MGNSSCPAAHAMPHDPKKFIENGEWFFKAHQVGWIVAGFFALIATAASAWLIRKHLQFYHNPDQQRQIVRILIMVPIYAIVSWLSFFFWEQALYFEVLRDCYEAVVITAFFYLLIFYIGDAPTFPHPNPKGDREVRRYYKAFKLKKWMFPMGFMSYRPRDGLYFLQLMKWCILQYAVLRPLCTFASVAAQYFGYYCVASWSPQFVHLWSVLIVSISVSVAMYCVLQLYSSAKEPLAPYRPILKFLAVKAVVFLTFWQVSALSLLITFGWLKDREYWSAEEINIGISAMLQCVEMAIFAFLHIKAFSYLPYRPEGTAAERKEEMTSQWKAFKHVMDFRDVFREIVYGSKYMVGTMKGKNMDHSRRDDLEDALGYERKDGTVREDDSDTDGEEFDEKARIYAEDRHSERAVVVPPGMTEKEAKEYKRFNKKHGGEFKAKPKYDPNFDEPSLTAIERDLLDAKARTGGDEARNEEPGSKIVNGTARPGMRNTTTGSTLQRDSYRFDPTDPRRTSRQLNNAAYSERSGPATTDSHRYSSTPSSRRGYADDHYRDPYANDAEEGRWAEDDPLNDPAARMMGFNGPRTAQKDDYASPRPSNDGGSRKAAPSAPKSKKEMIAAMKAAEKEQAKGGWMAKLSNKIVSKLDERYGDAETVRSDSPPPSAAACSEGSRGRRIRIEEPPQRAPPPAKDGPPPSHLPSVISLPSPLAQPEPIRPQVASPDSFYQDRSLCQQPPSSGRHSGSGWVEGRPPAARNQSSSHHSHGAPYSSSGRSRPGSMPVLPHPSQLYGNDDRHGSMPAYVVEPLRSRERVAYDGRGRNEPYYSPDPNFTPLHLVQPKPRMSLAPAPALPLTSAGSAYPSLSGSGSRNSGMRGTHATEADLVMGRRTSDPTGSSNFAGVGLRRVSGQEHRPAPQQYRSPPMPAPMPVRMHSAGPPAIYGSRMVPPPPEPEDRTRAWAQTNGASAPPPPGAAFVFEDY